MSCLVIFKCFFNVYGCLAYVCIYHMQFQEEARRGRQIPLDLKL